MSAWRIIEGDCLEAMAAMDDGSVDAVATDPPYGIGFMGKAWDSQAIGRAASKDAATRRSVGPHSPSRPGRKAARSSSAFGSPAHYAGPVRGGHEWQAWCEAWAAECLRVLKPGGHLLAFGGTRTYHRLTCGVEDAGFEIRDCLAWLYATGFPKSHNIGNGRGTALKPAHEPVVLARKPLTGTVARNVEAHGTGALNIDATRIPANGKTPFPVGDHGERGLYGVDGERTDDPNPSGRWPANVILDPEAAAMLDAQAGESTSRSGTPREGANGDGWGMTATGAEYDDRGGPSRFFYCAKASRREREAGLTGEERNVHPPSGDDRCWDIPGSRSKPRRNSHPTVKPVALMRWLVRLVTPPGGTILDPFAGSGTTGIACLLEGFEFVGIEREAEYVRIARERIAHAESHPHDFDPEMPEPEPVPEEQLSIEDAA